MRWRRAIIISAGAMISIYLKELGIDYLRYGPPYYRLTSGLRKYDWSLRPMKRSPRRRKWASRRSSTCATSACRIGSEISRTPTGRSTSRNIPRLCRAFPVGATLYARERDLCRRHVLRRLRLVERASGDRPRLGHRLKHLCQANVLACARFSRFGPMRLFIQSESTEYVPPRRPSEAPRLLHERTPVSLARSDLRPPRHRRHVRVPDRQRHDARRIPMVPAIARARSHCIMGTIITSPTSTLIQKTAT